MTLNFFYELSHESQFEIYSVFTSHGLCSVLSYGCNSVSIDIFAQKVYVIHDSHSPAGVSGADSEAGGGCDSGRGGAHQVL